jgi:hypothetical protein
MVAAHTVKQRLYRSLQISIAPVRCTRPLLGAERRERAADNWLAGMVSIRDARGNWSPGSMQCWPTWKRGASHFRAPANTSCGKSGRVRATRRGAANHRGPARTAGSHPVFPLQPAPSELFEILRRSNQESYRKEKEKEGSGRELEIWLGKRNPATNQFWRKSGFELRLWSTNCFDCRRNGGRGFRLSSQTVPLL